jgi:hypothetical protein
MKFGLNAEYSMSPLNGNVTRKTATFAISSRLTHGVMVKPNGLE